MEISLFIKIGLLIVALIATYAVVRNFDVIKIIKDWDLIVWNKIYQDISKIKCVLSNTFRL